MNKEIKTGTTCIAMKFKDGIIIAADNRVTSYKINADNFTKVFDLTENIVSTVSGGVADAQRFIRSIQSELKLISYKNEREVLVKEAAMTLSNYQYSTIRSSGGVVGMILAGYDSRNGLSLYELSPDGSILDNLDFVTSGSGSIFVDGVLGNSYSNNLSQKEALNLLDQSFSVAFKNDNASGGGYIAKVITSNGIENMPRKIVKTQLVNE